MWQPIQTAPKVPTVKLLGFGLFSDCGDHALPGCQIMVWSDLAQVWAVSCLPFEPTHWQHLPNPPYQDNLK